MESKSDAGAVTCFCAADSSSTGSRLRAGVPVVQSMSEKIFHTLQDKLLRKAMVEIAEMEQEVENHIKYSVDDALTSSIVRSALQAAVAEALTQSMVFDVLVAAIKNQEGYKQHTAVCMVPEAKRISAEYVANVKSVTIGAL